MNELVQILFSIPSSAAEAVCNLLTEEGSGVEQRDSETTPSLENGNTQLLIWVPSSTVTRRVEEVEKLLTDLKVMGIQIDPWSWDSQSVDPDTWKDVYKKHFTVSRLGRYIVAKPSWEEYTPQMEDLLIEIDPGMAFGTGLHASTRLVIHIMERLARSCPSPLTVLDIGCGTGILAIAAAKLWPNAQVTAIDSDELAVQVCKENVDRNNLSERIVIEKQFATQMHGLYDLILANLSMETLTELQPNMRGYINDLGRMVLSGLLNDQANGVARLYCKELVWEPEYSESMDEWMAVLLRVR